MDTRLLAEVDSPWNHLAKRFIEAPVYRLCEPRAPAAHADLWRLEMVQDGLRHAVESDRPVLDAAPIWPKLRVGGWIQCSILQIDRGQKWVVAATPMGVRVRGTGV